MNQPQATDRTASPRWALPATAATLLLSLGLAACQPQTDNTAQPTMRERIDNSVASAEARAAQAKAELDAAAAQARASASSATETAGTAIQDASITTAVSAKLAADPDLSALRINVDTSEGRVALSGDAPTAAARERASELARSVKGVVDVDNRLTIQSRS